MTPNKIPKAIKPLDCFPNKIPQERERDLRTFLEYHTGNIVWDNMNIYDWLELADLCLKKIREDFMEDEDDK
jgi:hypothetical protein